MKREFSGHIFNTYSNFKFNDNPYSENQVVQCGQTDGPTDEQS